VVAASAASAKHQHNRMYRNSAARVMWQQSGNMARGGIMVASRSGSSVYQKA